MDRTQNYTPPVPVQFRPMVPAPQPNQFIQFSQQHFQPAGQGVSAINVGLPQAQSVQFSQSMQHLSVRPSHPELGPPLSQAVPFPGNHPNMPLASGSAIVQPCNVQALDTYAPGQSGTGAPLSSSFSFAPNSYSQPAVNFSTMNQYHAMSQTLPPSTQMLVPPFQLNPPHSQIFASTSHMFPEPSQAAGPSVQMQPNVLAAGLPGSTSESQSRVPAIPVQENVGQPATTAAITHAQHVQSDCSENVSTDWIEHINSEGKRYYYNKKTKQSSWEKPLELMTLIERADATTDWRECTSPDGRKYYYNKVTKRSTWTIPEELKLARRQVQKVSSERTSTSVATSVVNTVSTEAVATSSAAVVPEANAAAPQAAVISEIAVTHVSNSKAVEKADDVQPTLTAFGDAGSGAAITADNVTELMNPPSNSLPNIDNDASAKDMEKGQSAEISQKTDNNGQEEKGVELKPLVYATKLDAKIAFKELLESTLVGSDWTWDKAMRVIINDKRYGALKSLGERKQAFTEYLTQKKKLEADERRTRYKKAREEFKLMLEECKELTSSTRWSKAVAIIEEDDRFKAVERDRDRKDLYESYIKELEKKERAKAKEEWKKNRLEYRKFLESCDFIKANTQWRKVQDRLETDERCRGLEKFDRLEIFQEYVHDLEKEEEEQKSIQKEELRKSERKNRDEFRKLLEEHIAAGDITAKTHWRDYCTTVHDVPAYQAVASNTSGSTPKNLFDDFAEELQKQYYDDRTRIKDTLKLAKIPLSSTWSFEEFKGAILVNVGSPSISDINVKLVFDELLEKVRRKEEKEAKKRQRLSDDFFDLLCSIKEITGSSEWDECKHHFSSSREYSSIGDENLCMELFHEYVGKLKENAKENDHRRIEEKARKGKDREERDLRRTKQRREKERGNEREKHGHSRQVRKNDEKEDQAHEYDDNQRFGEDNDDYQKRRHHSNKDDMNVNVTADSMSSHTCNNDSKKSKQHSSTSDSDSGSRRKRHKKDYRTGCSKNDNEDLAD